MERWLHAVARGIVAIAGLGASLVSLALAGAALIPGGLATLPLLGYGALVVFALLGYRPPAVIVAVTAWLIAVISWIWLTNILSNPPLVNAGTTPRWWSPSWRASSSGSMRSRRPTSRCGHRRPPRSAM